MHLTGLIACDYAQVRENLLFVASGGLTNVIRPNFPAPLGIYVAVTAEADEDDPTGGEIALRLATMDDTPIVEVTATLEPASTLLSPTTFPLVIDLRAAIVPSPGRYKIDASHKDQKLSVSLVAIIHEPPGPSPIADTTL